MNYIAIDFETYFDRKAGYDLRSMSITEYLRDPRFKVHGYAWTFSDGLIRWDCAPEPLQAEDWSNVALVGHNLKFDAALLAWHYNIVPAQYIDTKGLARAILGNYISGYSLSEVGRYLGLEAKGTVLKEFDGLRDLNLEQRCTLGSYCMTDVQICKGIFEKLYPQFPDAEKFNLDWTIRSFVKPELKLDLEVLERMVNNERTRRDALISQSGYTREQLSSNKQFAELVQRTCGSVPTKTSARTNKQIPALSLSDPGFLSLRDTNPELFEARKAAKSTIIETRGEALINVGKTGLWPFDVQFSGAVQTHRYSGGDGAGGNPQNFPKSSDIRASVYSDVGLVVGDFSAIELRLNAWLAKETWILDMLENGEDIYAAFASKVYGRQITRDNKAERQFGKCSELGLGYGLGADKFIHTVYLQTGQNISAKQSLHTVQLYRKTHPNIRKNWIEAEKLIPMMISGKPERVFFAPFLCVEKDSIRLPGGLKLTYPNLRKDGDEWVYDKFFKKYETTPVKLYGGKLIENICQALASELCKHAIKLAIASGINVVGQVHDEILAIRKDHNTINELTDCMETPPEWAKSLLIRAEVSEGRTWLEAKK